MTRHAAQGLGSILDIAEARSREVDRELRRAEALVFAAEEGAYTPRLLSLTPATSSASPVPLIHPSEQGAFEAFRWGLATGFVFGLGAALIVFVGSQVLIGWFS